MAVKAVVMAGGEGTRLRPLTSNLPKPMINVANRPVMEYILLLLKRHGIEEVVVTLHFLPQLIRHYFSSGKDFGMAIKYVTEEEPLGTAGGVKNAERYLDDTFIVISGDALTDFNLTHIIEFHKKKKALITIALKEVENPLEFGIVITEKDGKIEKFLEKPGWGGVFSNTVNTGIYVIEPEVLNYIPTDRPFDFSKDLFPKLLEEKKPLYGYVADGYWCDIGDLEQYRKANFDLLLGRVKFEPAGIKMANHVWVGEGVSIDPKAKIDGPSLIGPHVKIEKGVRVGELSIVGHNAVLKEGAHIHRAIVADNVFIGANTVLHNCIIGRNSEIRKGARVEERAVIGDECIVGADTVIGHDVKIYPFKTVEAGAIVNRSIVWETRGVRTLFGPQGAQGLINVDITPDFALRLAMAYGSLLPVGSTVVCGRDASWAARMINRAIIAGLTGVGINVRDLRVCSAPIARFAVVNSASQGGIHIRIAPFDNQSLQIQFFNEKGIDIEEDFQRKIERYFFREDFRRAFYSEIGKIEYQARMMEYYSSALCKVFSLCEMKKLDKKIVVDHSFGTSALVFPFILGKIGCDAISLNAYTDENRTTLSFDEFERALNNLSETVKVFQADFGVLIDSAGEKIYLIDNEGKRVSPDVLLLLFIKLVSSLEKRKGKIALPVSVSYLAEEIAAAHGRKVLRVKMSPAEWMKAATRPDVVFAGAQGGGFIFPRFIPAYDGVMSVLKLLEYLSAFKQPLSEILEEIPQPSLVQKVVYCSWEKKGEVIRVLVEKYREAEKDLLDGVKIYHGSKKKWALVLPDPVDPVLRIYTEGKDNREALALAEDMIEQVKEIIEV